ncbi:MAG: hypothetical protein R3290_05945 [Acidimicrobiia bacterium]|nr:hypothetical protein [Acidimicrobiia bacterium]
MAAIDLPTPSTLGRRVREAFRGDRRVLVVLGGLLGTVLVLGIMRFDLVLAANTPTGGDMGAHVLIPAYVRDNLVPEFRIMGWSNDWYAGFPVLYFYFPLPALAIVLLDVVLPYGVAFKLVTVAGLGALPFASYYFARAMGFARPVALVGGISGFTFVFMESFSIFGANTLSTLAGEYSFSWSFAISLVYLGMLVRNVREGRGFTAGTAVVLALTALSHIITTAVIVVASLPLLFKRRGPENLAGSWGLGFALAGFWAVPLLATFTDYTTDMGWSPVRGFQNVVPREMWPIVLLATVGILWSVARKRIVGPALALAIIPVAGYYLIEYFDYTKLYNARLLPFWYYTAYLFAGLAVGMAVVAVARRFHASPTTIWAGTAAATVFLLLVAGIGVNKAPAWARWNYSGYEGKQTYAFDAEGTPILQDDNWAEYRALMVELDALPPGRVMWEANSELNQYGTPMALMLTGYWSEGHASMEGLLFESSLTTPFHFLNAAEVSSRPSNPIGGLDYHRLNFERAVEHLALYDVAYYVSFTDEATEAAGEFGLERLAETDPFTIWALPESSLVDVAEFEPIVWEGDEGFVEAALEWYDDVDRLDRWLVAEGPEAWERVDEISRSTTRTRIAGSGSVSDVVLDDHRISFSTTAVGVPHLVKVSAFPNWQADGAEGPYRAAPSLMVVVPTREDVVIEFRDTWAENLGMLLTVGGLGYLGWWAWRRRRSEEPPTAPATAASGSATAPPGSGGRG